MSKTSGRLTIDSGLVAAPFQDLINEAALKRYFPASVDAERCRLDRFSGWLSREKQQTLAALLVSVATVQSCQFLVDQTPRTQTVVFPAPKIQSIDEHWLGDQIAIAVDAASVQFDQLYGQVAGAAEAALVRLLPSAMSEEQARAWAEDLVRSIRG